MKTTDRKHWTAIFMIRGTTLMVDPMIAVLEQLTTLKKTDTLSVIICIRMQADIFSDHLPRKPNAVRSGWTTLFYLLGDNADGSRSLQLLEEDPEFDYHRQSDVSGFFVNKVLCHAPADEYMLFTWDHGQPFGIFAGTDDTDDSDVPAAKVRSNPLPVHFRALHELRHELQQEPGSRVAEVDIPDNDALNILTITELKNAIQWAFGDRKMALIVMSNCNLQFFDTGYELSACAEYLVAFETAFYYNSFFDYRKILEAAGGAGVTSIDLVKIAVKSFGMGPNGKLGKSKNEVALFGNKLCTYQKMATIIDQLAGTLIAQLPENFSSIRKAVNQCQYITANIPEYCLIDFQNFVHALYDCLPEVFSTLPLAYVNQTINDIVVQSFVGTRFQKKAYSTMAPSCFSIYLPQSPGDYRTSFLENYMSKTSLTASEFTRKFKWQAFVKKYIGCFPNES